MGRGRGTLSATVGVAPRTGPTTNWDPSGRTGDDWQDTTVAWRNWSNDSERYMRGGCGALAAALHDLTGWPLYATSNRDEHEVADPHDIFEIEPDHIWVRHPSGRALDIRGLSPMPSGAGVYPIDRDQLEELMGADWVGHPGEHPAAPTVAAALLSAFGGPPAGRA